jgi:hypothetical protein
MAMPRPPMRSDKDDAEFYNMVQRQLHAGNGEVVAYVCAVVLRPLGGATSMTVMASGHLAHDESLLVAESAVKVIRESMSAGN